jgi:DNA polymerase III alpha subunit (gram-positive type)
MITRQPPQQQQQQPRKENTSTYIQKEEEEEARVTLASSTPCHKPTSQHCRVTVGGHITQQKKRTTRTHNRFVYIIIINSQYLLHREKDRSLALSLL